MTLDVVEISGIYLKITDQLAKMKTLLIGANLYITDISAKSSGELQNLYSTDQKIFSIQFGKSVIYRA